MATKFDIDMKVQIKFRWNTTATTIKRKNCNEVVKDLGVLVNPEGDFCPEFEQREDQYTRHAMSQTLIHIGKECV
eukprot:3642743-Ditylum_brightwellii.AAC.1